MSTIDDLFLPDGMLGERFASEFQRQRRKDTTRVAIEADEVRALLTTA